jgi:hypothetical protein
MNMHGFPGANPVAPFLPTHQDTVFLAQLRGDGSDVCQPGCAQGAKEAGLAILVAGEEAVLCDHQAARDTGAGSYALGYDLDIGRR